MVLIAVSTILSVMIINLGQPSSTRPPKWLLKVSELNLSGADPGFPVGAWTRFGGVDLQHGHFLVKMNVKMKESGPVGGVRRKILDVDPPMSFANTITKK